MEPSFISDGATPRRTDSRWFRWLKILGVIQNEAGADPDNNPRRSDTIRMLQEKVNKALN